MNLLAEYGNAPGKAAQPPGQWPEESLLNLAPSAATLVMFAHPRCPCTRASMGELERLMARVQGRVKTYVVFIRPAGFASNWEKTDLWHRAAAIPAVSPLLDEQGREARIFRAATSGQTLLYDGSGRLLFSGGITAARGHAGDNFGRSRIVALLRAGRSATGQPSECAVYGCRLFTDI